MEVVKRHWWKMWCFNVCTYLKRKQASAAHLHFGKVSSFRFRQNQRYTLVASSGCNSIDGTAYVVSVDFGVVRIVHSGVCGSDSRHRLVDRLYHVQATIAAAMRELSTSRSDPRVAQLVWSRLRSRRRYTAHRRAAARAAERLRRRTFRYNTALESSASGLGLVSLDANNQYLLRYTAP